MRKVSVGPCPLCYKNIWKYRRPKLINLSRGALVICLQKIPYEQTDEGTHFWVLLTDSTRMRIAICKSCLSILSDDHVKQIFADITYTKLEAIKKDKRLTEDRRYKLFDRVRTIEVWKWAKKTGRVFNLTRSEYYAKTHETQQTNQR